MFGEFTLGVQTWIDTSAAGFSRVPCYFAWLEGSLWNAQTLQLVPAIFPSITDESVTGFTFRLWLEAAFPQSTGPNIRGPARSLSLSAGGPLFNFVVDPGDFVLFAQQQDLYVTWIACQMTTTPVSCCSMNSAVGATQTSAGAQIS